MVGEDRGWVIRGRGERGEGGGGGKRGRGFIIGVYRCNGTEP